MKNNYNPYTVPEEFFERCADEAVSIYGMRRKNFRRGLATAALLVLLIAVPAFIRNGQEQTAPDEVYSNNLAEMYEYDIFLQVNF